MGQIHVTGLGVVEISGDSPTDEEADAIISALSQSQPEPAIPEPITASQTGDVGKTAGERVGEGPFGIVSPETRGRVREAVVQSPGLFELIAEMGPSVAGAIIGSPGGIPGATAGSVVGELAAQEVGLAPASPENVALSAAGPAAGVGIGKALQAGRKVIGKGISHIPPIKTARARITAEKAHGYLESVGSRVLNRAGDVAEKAGLKVRVMTADDLFTAVRKSGVTMSGDDFVNTQTAVANLTEEMSKFSAFPEVEQSIKLLQKTAETLSGEIDFKTLIGAKQAIGAAIRRSETAGGVKLGAAKKAFSALSSDIDALTKKAPTEKAAKLLKAATARAKLEFAVKDFEQIVAKHSRAIPGEDGFIINAKNMLNELVDITNPKHKRFDKNFTDALKGELPEIRKSLSAMAKLMSRGLGSSAGPGSIVVRGRLAHAGSTVVGALIGGAVGGPIATGVGAMVGAAGPEMITAALISKTGRKLMERMISMGGGEINQRMWMALGDVVLRSAGADEEEIQLFKTGPETTGQQSAREAGQSLKKQFPGLMGLDFGRAL